MSLLQEHSNDNLAGIQETNMVWFAGTNEDGYGGLHDCCPPTSGWQIEGYVCEHYAAPGTFMIGLNRAFEDAEAFCVSEYHGHLATVHRQADYDRLLAMATGYDQPILLGGRSDGAGVSAQQRVVNFLSLSVSQPFTAFPRCRLRCCCCSLPFRSLTKPVVCGRRPGNGLTALSGTTTSSLPTPGELAFRACCPLHHRSRSTRFAECCPFFRPWRWPRPAAAAAAAPVLAAQDPHHPVDDCRDSLLDPSGGATEDQLVIYPPVCADDWVQAGGRNEGQGCGSADTTGGDDEHDNHALHAWGHVAGNTVGGAPETYAFACSTGGSDYQPPVVAAGSTLGGGGH